MDLHIIAAVSENGVIGKDGQIPWHIPEDLKRFKELTNSHPVIMGRVTYESLPERFRPLPNRQNIVVTNNRSFQTPSGVIVACSPKEASQRASNLDADVYVIGGATIYGAFLPSAKFLNITRVHKKIEGENLTLFPAYRASKWHETAREDRDGFSFVDYQRIKN